MSYTFRHHTLANGLTIIAESSPSAHSAAVGFFVKTGARDESTRDMGVSHFLEHMMFKGAEGLSAEDLNRAFDEIGARNNAFTSNEMTCFYAHTLPEALPRATELLGRMLRPSLRQEDFDTEKNVILEEIAMYKDIPSFVLFEAAVEKHFGAHPLAHRVLGTTDSITALPRDRMRAYFDARYAADNTAVALAGRVDFDAACRQVDSLCGGWAATGVSRDPAVPPPVGGEFTQRMDSVNRGYLIAMAPAPSASDDRRYAAALLAAILGSSDNSRFHWALVEPGLAESAQASFDPHDGYGEFIVFAAADPDRLDEVWDVMQREMATLRDSLQESDLARLRAKVATAATLSGERPLDRMQRLGRLWTTLGRYQSLDEELDCINAVTLDDLRAVADTWPLSMVTVGRLLPKV
ncbi:MAG: zinc protease [Phycisphaerae bacterium]|nr:MAG: zinc protease [Phycisphaerae bacterium]